MRGIKIVSEDRDIEIGVTKVLVHLPTPLDGMREWLGTVTKINTNNNTLNVSVATRDGDKPVLGVTMGSIPDDRMAWASWPVDDESAQG